MKLDILEILKSLKKKRPVFHFEADFQLTLAQYLRKTYPHLQIYLEHPINLSGKKRNCDIVLFQGGKVVMAIELKYFCRNLNYEHKGEIFTLKSAPADTGRYGTLKDIERMEKFIKDIQNAENRVVQASVITLTNDPELWEGSKPNRTDADFDIKEGRIVSGTLKWAQHTSINTKHDFPKINLFGKYTMKWQDYSHVDENNGRLRYLHIPIQHP